VALAGGAFAALNPKSWRGKKDGGRQKEEYQDFNMTRTMTMALE